MVITDSKKDKQKALLSPQIGVIIPSFNDARIVHAIWSVTKHDPTGLTRLYIIDGGSRQEIIDLIRRHIRPHDYFITERDRGIFDALNKGLDVVSEELLTWLGSDDFFTQHIDFPSVVDAFASERLDCYVFDLVYADDIRARRRTRAVAPTLPNSRLGRHVQHFSSFWRMSRIGKTRFDLTYKIAGDIEFFCRMAESEPLKTKLDHRVGTIARLGGNSSKDLWRILIANLEVYRIYCRHMGPVGASFATVCKLIRKTSSQFINPHYGIVGEMTDLIIRT